jgi:hypothetical protein
MVPLALILAVFACFLYLLVTGTRKLPPSERAAAIKLALLILFALASFAFVFVFEM